MYAFYPEPVQPANSTLKTATVAPKPQESKMTTVAATTSILQNTPLYPLVLKMRQNPKVAIPVALLVAAVVVAAVVAAIVVPTVLSNANQTVPPSTKEAKTDTEVNNEDFWGSNWLYFVIGGVGLVLLLGAIFFGVFTYRRTHGQKFLCWTNEDSESFLCFNEVDDDSGSDHGKADEIYADDKELDVGNSELVRLDESS